MVVLLVLCLPIVAFAVWAVVHDIRHRKDQVTGADPHRAAARARAADHARGLTPPGDGGFHSAG